MNCHAYQMKTPAAAQWHAHPQNKLYLRVLQCSPLPSHDLQPFCITTKALVAAHHLWGAGGEGTGGLINCWAAVRTSEDEDILVKAELFFTVSFWRVIFIVRALDLSLCSDSYPCEAIRCWTVWEFVWQSHSRYFFNTLQAWRNWNNSMEIFPSGC